MDQKTARVKGQDTCAILEKTTGMHATFAKTIDLQGGEYGNVVLSREVPLDAQMTKVPQRCTAAFDFYRISFATFGRRVYGYMSVPTDKAKAPYPVIFEVSRFTSSRTSVPAPVFTTESALSIAHESRVVVPAGTLSVSRSPLPCE